MPHFLILTYFAVAVAAWSAVLALLAAVPSFRGAVRTGWRMLVGSSVGFVVANLFALVVGIVPALIAMAFQVDRDSPSAPLVAAFALVGLFFGPLVASPIGFVGGAWIGRRRALRVALGQRVPVRQ